MWGRGRPGDGGHQGGAGVTCCQAMEIGDLLQPPQGQPSHSEGSESPRTTGRVSSVAGGRATGGPFCRHHGWLCGCLGDVMQRKIS